MRRKGENLSMLLYILGTMACFYIAGHITFKSSYSCNAITTAGPVEKGVTRPNDITGNSAPSASHPLTVVARKTGKPVKISKLRSEILMAWTGLGFIAACFIYGGTLFATTTTMSDIRIAVVSCSFVGFVLGAILGFFPSLLLSITVHRAVFPPSYEASSYINIIGIGCLSTGLAGLISGPVALKIRLLPESTNE